MKKTLDKKEKLLLANEEPKGKNNLSSRASFMQEKLFHQNSYNSVEFFLTSKPADFYYDNLFYGRTDKDSLAVVPKEDSLVQIKQSSEIVKCQNFVADAFSDFYSFWELSKRRDFISTDSELYNIDNVTAFKDPINSHREFLSEQNKQFFSSIRSSGRIKNITSFNSFLQFWSRFADQKTNLVPITLSSYILSKFSDPKVSGLIIDLVDADIIDDNIKYNNFIKDPNYIFFFNSAQTFGFSIDKKIPWRLIANIDSIPMKEYLKKYNLNSNNLFNTNFNLIYKFDFNLIKNLFFSFYEDFIEQEPFFVKSEIFRCEKTGLKVKNKIEYRQKMLQQKEETFLRFYLFVRAKESNLGWDQNKFDNFVAEVSLIYKTLDLQRSLRYAEQRLILRTPGERKRSKFKF